MKLDDVVRLNELFDAYGELLTNYQRDVLSDFLKYNLTFSEIAENRKVSRQASFMVLNKCIKKLEDFEEKVGALKAKKEYKENVSKALSLLEKGNTQSAIDILKKEV